MIHVNEFRKVWEMLQDANLTSVKRAVAAEA